MDRLNYTTKRAKGKHLNYEDRIKIETLNKIGPMSIKWTRKKWKINKKKFRPD